MMEEAMQTRSLMSGSVVIIMFSMTVIAAVSENNTIIPIEDQESADMHQEDIDSIIDFSSGNGFEYHAYLRSGVLEGGKGGQGVPFQAPNAQAKYRLGNEAETYGELILQKDFNVGNEGLQSTIPIRLAYKTYEYSTWSPDTDEFTISEAYGQFSEFNLNSGMRLWAGVKFYDRRDIHINDFYWLDTSGYGGGMENFVIGDSGMNFNIAYLRGAPEQNYTLEGIGLITKQTIDIRLKQINIGLGSLDLVFLGSFVKGGEYETTLTKDSEEQTITTTIDSEYGFSACLIHNLTYDGDNFNTMAFQYGSGVGKDFNSRLSAVDDVVDSDTWRFRWLDFGIYQPNAHFAMMYSLIYDCYDNGADNAEYTYWYSAGIRPTYYLDKNWSIAFELGYDYTIGEGQADNGNDLKGSVTKATICPQLALDNFFMARPVLRAFVTYAFWSDDFENIVGGEAHTQDTDGLNFGFQVEAWF